MGISRSKSKTKPNKYAEPYVTAAGQSLAPAYQEQSETAKAFMPGLREAGDFQLGVMRGEGFGKGPAYESNPHLETMVAAANRDSRDMVNSTFMPRFGSAYHAKALADRIAENEARLRGADYERERGFLLDNYTRERANQIDAGRQYAGLAASATELPGIPATQYAGNVSGLMGRYLNTSTSTPWGPALLGGASNAAAAYFGSKKG